MGTLRPVSSRPYVSISSGASDPSGLWYDGAKSRGVLIHGEDDRVVSWGTELADLNNDGLIDAMAAFGRHTAFEEEVNGKRNPTLQPDALWLQQADGSLVQAADDWGIADEEQGRGFALIDLNDDGFLDIIKRDFMGGLSKVYMSRCDDRAWLKVKLHGVSPNTPAAGARIELDAGEQQVRWILAGGSSLATSLPPEAHFGLGDVDIIDELRVFWPDGTRSTWHDIASRQHLDIHQIDAPLD